MAVTRKFTLAKVGDKCPNYAVDVRTVQELLIAAGETVVGGADGGWGKHTADALLSFQRKWAKYGLKEQRHVDVGDYALLLMAWHANILIPMPGKSGMPGVLEMHRWFQQNNIKYNDGAQRGQGDRAVYGVDGDKRYAIQLTSLHWKRGPIEMDCTTYVNMMLGILINGCIHSAPYDANCGDFGGVSAIHCARDRYKLPLIRRKADDGSSDKTYNYFRSAEDIQSVTANDRSGVYAIEVAGGGSGAVSHMALLNNDTVYECTTGQSGSACINRSLSEFTRSKSGKIYYLFGPSTVRH
jgi:hypothetical protein